MGPRAVHAQAESGDRCRKRREVDSGGIRMSQTKAAWIKAHFDSGDAAITLGKHWRLRTQGSRRVRPALWATELAISGTVPRRHVAGKLRRGRTAGGVRTDSG